MISKISATKDRLVIVSPDLKNGVLVIDRTGGKIKKRFHDYYDQENNLSFWFEPVQDYTLFSITKNEFTFNEENISIKISSDETRINFSPSKWYDFNRAKARITKEQVAEVSKFIKPLMADIIEAKKYMIEARNKAKK